MPMTRAFSNYRRAGHRFVEGWMHPEVLDILKVLDAAQRQQEIRGSVAEIGVHHGKLFIGLHLLRQDAETSLAIDLFEDQDLNIDKSGRGNFRKFESNLSRWADNTRVVTHQGDSTDLSGDQVKALAGSPIRLFSVDGGHTEEIVRKDMQTAEGSLAEGGIVIADDVFNSQWPGVAVGTIRYLDAGGVLEPFAVGLNKVFFATAPYATTYRSAIRSTFGNRVRLAHKTSEMMGHDVEILYRVRASPRRFLRRSDRLRALRDSIRDRSEHYSALSASDTITQEATVAIRSRSSAQRSVTPADHIPVRHIPEARDQWPEQRQTIGRRDLRRDYVTVRVRWVLISLHARDDRAGGAVHLELNPAVCVVVAPVRLDFRSLR